MKTTSIIALVLVVSPLAASARLSRTLQDPLPLVAPNLYHCARFAVHGASTTASGTDTVVYGDVGGDSTVNGFGLEGHVSLPHVFPGKDYNIYATGTDETMACSASKLTAYNEAKAAHCDNAETAADLSGLTLTSGVYCNVPGYFMLNAGNLTLDAEGDRDAVFIFQTASTVTTAVNTKVVLKNGAQAKNVFWAAGSAITLSQDSTFRGNMLAYSAITIGSRAIVSGRALARVAAVTLAGDNSVSLPELSVNGGSDLLQKDFD